MECGHRHTDKFQLPISDLCSFIYFKTLIKLHSPVAPWLTHLSQNRKAFPRGDTNSLMVFKRKRKKLPNQMCVSICCGNQSIHSTSQHLSSVTFFDSFFNLPEVLFLTVYFYNPHVWHRICKCLFTSNFDILALLTLSRSLFLFLPPPQYPQRFYLVSGGVPLIICGVTAAVNIDNYGSREQAL